MIEETNKSIYQSREKKEETFHNVQDDVGKVLTLKENDYGKVESNPFNSQMIINPYGRGNFNSVVSSKKFEYDFAETNRIVDTESLVAAIFRRKKSLVLKEEPGFKCSVDRNTEYIKKRILEMEYVSGTTFSELLEAITESLINFNNVFLLKNRNEFASSGNFVDGVAPLAAIHVLSPTRLSPIENDIGDIVGYTYKSKKAYQTLNLSKSDIYHIYSDKKIDLSVGTPPLESVRDDILALRQVEECIERLIYKNSAPLMHIKVGNDKYPATRLPDGSSEIDYYTNLVAQMDDSGGLTTSNRVEIDLLTVESSLKLRDYVDYFKSRVLAGLKASILDIGEAGTISTAGAQFVSEVLKQDVISYQRIIERFFTDKLFNDLLLEADWYKNKKRVPQEEQVKLVLYDPDLDTQIKYESHLANLVRYGLLEPKEFSEETGWELPSVTFTPNQISANISSNTGVFSAQTTPQNQHTSAIDAEYQVLDEIINDESDKAFSKLYFYIEDNFKEVLGDTVKLDEFTSDLLYLIKRYKNNGIQSKIIVETLNSTIENTIFENI